MEDSPISDQALEALAERVAAQFRRVAPRAPREVKRETREALEGVFRVVQGGTAGAQDAVRRVALVRKLEKLDAELHGRDDFTTDFYTAGRLGIIRAFNPVRIRWAVRHRWVTQQYQRYEHRVERNQARLAWFYERVGWEVEEAPKKKPWELPYAALEEDREFLWGRRIRG